MVDVFSEPPGDILYPGLQRFLMQDMREAAPMSDSLRQLKAALQEDKAAPTPGSGARGARPQHNPYEGHNG